MQLVVARVRETLGRPPRTGPGRRECAYGAEGRLHVLEDSDGVFQAAIRHGVLSDDPASARYAGHYMYLFHDAHGTAWFKHRDSRVSVTMPGPARTPERRA